MTTGQWFLIEQDVIERNTKYTSRIIDKTAPIV